MMDLFWELVVICTCAVGLTAYGLDPLPKRVLRIVTLYYAIAYIGRGAFLLTFDPDPGWGTFIADSLLLQPTYFGGLSRLAPLAAGGLAAIIGGFYIASATSSTHGSRSRRLSGWRASAIGTAALAWPIRVASALSGVSRPAGVAGQLAVVPGVMLGILIVSTDWRRSKSGRIAVVLLTLGEVYWSFQTDTKTPMLAAAAFFYLDPNRRQLSWRMVIGGAIAFSLAFGILQAEKTDLHPSDYADTPALAPAARVLVRFDLLRALTVAETAGVGDYMPADEFLSRAVNAWIPSAIAGDSNAVSGVLWGQRINGSTSGTSISDGPAAEGYVMAGMVGAIVWSIAAGAIAGLAAKAIARQRSYLFVLIAVSMIASNAVFERGLLGLNEALSNAAQIALVATGPYLLVRAALAQQSRRQPVRRSRVASHASVAFARRMHRGCA